MSKDRTLLEKALEAITAVFSDTSVSQTDTIEDLCELKGEIETMLDTLKGGE
jgi:hypothetical protein